jgi:hypothetical protein
MGRNETRPSKYLENTFRVVNKVFNYVGVPYWLSFGGLWAIARNNGIIPDGDLDLCTYYGADYTRIEKAFKSCPGRYELHKTILSDIDGKALYCSYGSPDEGFPHICVSFWYLNNGIRYYCHDQMHEVEKGAGVPKSGYWFRGIKAAAVEDKKDNFALVEWPGINQQVKIRVPTKHCGEILDCMYPCWAFKRQKYVVKTGMVDTNKLDSYYHGGAISPYSVHVKSMSDWNNTKNIEDQIQESTRAWEKVLNDIN